MTIAVIRPGSLPVVRLGENTGEAARQAVRAETAADTSESARDGAQLAAAAVGTFTSVAAGESATTDGQTFYVVEDSELKLYLNDSGTGVEIAEPVTAANLASTDPGKGAALSNNRRANATSALTVKTEIDHLAYPLEAFRSSPVDEDATLFERAAANMDPAEVLSLTSGAEYDLETTIVRSGSWAIRGNDAKLWQRADAGVLTFRNAYGSPLPVTAIDNAATYDYSDGDAAPTACAKITVTGSPPPVNTLCKILSDDALVGSDPSGEERRGEFVWVGAVDGSDIYTISPLVDTYTTNVRLAAVDQSARLDLRDLRFGADDAGDAGGWTKGVVMVDGYACPIIDNLHFSRGYGAGLTLLGCWGARASRITALDLFDDPDGGRYGYGVLDVSSEFTQLSHLAGYRCRHLFTTATNPTDTDDNRVQRYGRSRYGRLSDSEAHDCHMAFDTHSDAQGWTFSSLLAKGSLRGPGSTQAGFQIRGLQNRLENCRYTGPGYGFHLWQQYADGTQDIALIDCEATGAVAIRASGDTGGAPLRVDIDGFRFSGTSHYIWGGHYKIRDRRADIRSTASTNSLALVRAGAGAQIDMRAFEIDLTGASATSLNVVQAFDAGVVAKLGRGRITGAGGNTLNSVIAGGSQDIVAEAGGVGERIEIDALPQTSAGVASMGSATSVITNLRYAGTNNQTFFKTETISGGTPGALDQGTSAADEVFVFTTTTDAGDGYNNAAAGAFAGQKLTIFNRAGSGGHDLTLKHNTSGGALFQLVVDVTIPPGSSATLTWTGTVWRA